MRIVLKSTSKLGDGSNQDIVSNKNILPDRLAEVLPGDNIAPMSGQSNQNLHYLRFKVYRRIIAINFIESGTNQSSAYSEITLHTWPQSVQIVVYNSRSDWGRLRKRTAAPST